MSDPVVNPKCLRFGLFELDLEARELRKSGLRIKLQDQPFQILAMLLERPGEVVIREELQKRLWPEDTFVDFDLSLNSAVKKLRQALSDDSENPRFIETLYRRGYRFIGPVNGTSLPSAPTLGLAEAVPTPPVSERTSPSVRARNFHVLPWVIIAVLVLVAAGVFWSTRSQPPRITGYTQITRDGRYKGFGGLVAGGERLYINEIELDRFVISQVSVFGGETGILPTPFRNVGVEDIAPNGSAILVRAFEGTAKETSVWAIPLPAGSPHRLGDLAVTAATWSPGATELVFSKGQDIFIANGEGGNPHKLATVGGWAADLRFAPDGQRIRFTVWDPKNDSQSLWELNRDGSGLHPVLPGWNDSPQESDGNWTSDGKFFVFQSFRGGRFNLWVLPERAHWFRGRADPVQLTNGPLDFTLPVPSRDGKRIFSVGVQPRAELVRYDTKIGFIPYLAGMSAIGLAFSPDGQWVAYVSVPDQALWRSKADGTERLQLTNASEVRAGMPRWSPDGKQIVFMGRTINTNWRAYLVSPNGGAPQDLMPGAEAGSDPTWSPDGGSIVLSLHNAGPTSRGISILDLKTKKVSELPGAENLFSPRWSPDGKYIAAITTDSQKLMLFDRGAGRWTELANMSIGYPSWSHDGQYLYFDTTLTDDPAFFRIRISDRKLERLVSLKGVQRFWGELGEWTGLAPDDSPLLVRDTSSQEIYALDFQAP
ncbi:MAG TPA: winged helix-turn-helix domain-containing protein [Terriglobales bacterium]|nr:winged helix-turn-helix domain-containing protein [Terriglobales bacterium]